MTRRDFLKKLACWVTAVGSFLLFGKGRLLRWAYAEAGQGLDLQDLRSIFIPEEARVLSAEDRDYDTARRIYNHRIDVRPRFIVLCRAATAIPKALAWAQALHIPVAVRGGGHCYEGYSVGPGMVIDVSPLNTVTLDAAARRFRVGAGTRLQSVYSTLAAHGLALSAGSCPDVGIAGLALGGGFGMLSRKWGMTADELLSLKIVAADGRTLEASPTQNPDLFWACRGGGGNFGVATEVEFRVRAIRPLKCF